jgi:hypothetical protein
MPKDAPATRRQQVITGVAAVLILTLALWLLLGRSPSGPSRVEADPGSPVETDVGTVTVYSVDPVPPGTRGTPAPVAGHEVRAIRFRSCRPGDTGEVVDLALFSVGFASSAPRAPAAGSNLSDSTGRCVGGLVYVQVPQGLAPSDVEYAADPLAVWRIGGA